MDTADLVQLVEWYEQKVTPVFSNYEQLVHVLEGNASNGQKQPVRPQLELLLPSLSSIPTHELNDSQRELLELQGAYHLIGRLGVHFINKTLASLHYDPASAATTMREARSRLERTHQRFRSISVSLQELGFSDVVVNFDDEMPEHKFMVRLRFREKAGIHNVVDLKNQGSNWFIIAKAISEAAGERPEDIEVAGASNGSIIVTLLVSAVSVRLIGVMVKCVAKMVLPSSSVKRLSD